MNHFFFLPSCGVGGDQEATKGGKETWFSSLPFLSADLGPRGPSVPPCSFFWEPGWGSLRQAP